MHQRDCAADLKKAIKKIGRAQFNPNHTLGFYGHRTLLMLAGWRGRGRMVKLLLEEGADAGQCVLCVCVRVGVDTSMFGLAGGVRRVSHR
jgi:hypothetical protein